MTEEIKAKLGRAACEYIQSGMRVGLGTGTTAAHFIEALIARKDLKIEAIASSNASRKAANEGGIPLLDPREVDSLDIYIDGADEVDDKSNMIKGAGGAFLKEKILARMSKKLIIMIDEDKRVARLGKCKLPIEVIRFGSRATLAQIRALGLSGSLRGEPTVTDEGNWIFDAQVNEPVEDLEEKLLRIPGVVETGLFLGYNPTLLIGHKSGKITTLSN